MGTRRARLTRGYPLRCYTLLVSLCVCVCVFAARLERRVGPKRCESAKDERLMLVAPGLRSLLGHLERRRDATLH